MRRWAATAAAIGGVLAVTAGTWAGVHATSPAVRGWSASTGLATRSGALAARSAGNGHFVIVLLSGLAGSERYWGAQFDELAAHATLVVIDPLGFGSSADLVVDGELSDPATHVRMVEATLAERGLSGRPVIVVGHSMGASLALRWAASTDAVRAVVCFGAPLYRTDAEVQRQMKGLGWFESLWSRGPLAEAVCHWMCHHRGAARRAAVVVSPELPTTIARDAIRHTWAGYIGAFTALIADNGWVSAVDVLARRGVPITLVEGDRDPAPVDGLAAQLADTHESVRVMTLRGDHHLPLARPEACLAVVRSSADRVASQY